MSDYKQKAIKGSIFILISLILSGLLSYILRMILSRKLPIQDYGLFFSMFAIFQFLVVFRSLGLREILPKFIPEFIVKEEFSKIKSSIVLSLIINFVMSIIFTIICISLSKIMQQNYFHHELAKEAFILLSMFFLISFVEEIIANVFLGMQNIIIYSLIPLFRSIFILIVTLILLNNDYGIFSVIYAYISSYFILPIIYIIILIKIEPIWIKYKLQIDKKLTKQLMEFGIFSVLTSTGSIILSYTDTFTLTIFKDLTQVALYQVAVPTATFIWLFSQSIATAIYPLVSELYTKNLINKLREGIRILHKYILLIIFPFCLIIFSFSDIIIKLLFGETYIKAAIPLQILTLGAIFYSIAIINSNIIAGIGFPKENTKIILIAAITNLILNIILVINFGINGVAFSTMISFLIMLILSTVFLKNKIDIHEPWKEWIKIVLIGIIIIILTKTVNRILQLNLIWGIVITLLQLIIEYLILTGLFNLYSIEEIKGVIKDFRK